MSLVGLLALLPVLVGPVVVLLPPSGKVGRAADEGSSTAVGEPFVSLEHDTVHIAKRATRRIVGRIGVFTGP
jgi:hypothetical protein